MEKPEVEQESSNNRDPKNYEREVKAFRNESHLSQEVQDEYKREALRKCNDLHAKLLTCYETKYFCGTIEKEFWDCYRHERGFKKSKVSAWAYKIHNKVSGEDEEEDENRKSINSLIF